jgi:hypothetical protein
MKQMCFSHYLHLLQICSTSYNNNISPNSLLILLAGVLHKNCKYGIADKIAYEKNQKPKRQNKVYYIKFRCHSQEVFKNYLPHKCTIYSVKSFKHYCLTLYFYVFFNLKAEFP